MARTADHEPSLTPAGGPGRRYDPCGRKVLIALLDWPGGARVIELAGEVSYSRNSVGTVYSLARYDGLIEPGKDRGRWQLTESGQVFAATLRELQTGGRP